MEDRVDRPMSLYAATKRADELMSYAYSDLYGIPATGLRFFTVYGPGVVRTWPPTFSPIDCAGRPIGCSTAARWSAISPISTISSGRHRLPTGRKAAEAPRCPYNIGNNRPKKVTRLITLIERTLNRKADIVMEPMQPGDVPKTFADIDAMQRDFGFQPSTSLERGRALRRLVPDPSWKSPNRAVGPAPGG